MFMENISVLIKLMQDCPDDVAAAVTDLSHVMTECQLFISRWWNTAFDCHSKFTTNINKERVVLRTPSSC